MDTHIQSVNVSQFILYSTITSIREKFKKKSGPYHYSPSTLVVR